MAQNVPYFPPPPTSAGAAKSRSRSKSSSSTKSDRSSKQASKPSALQRSRTYLVPTLLIFTFAIFVLAIIYSYCVATSHTQATSDHAASNQPVNFAGGSANATVSSTQASSTYESWAKPSAALVLYLITTPMLLMGLMSIELVLNYSYQQIISGRRGHIALLSSYTTSLVGLIISSAFWTSCELPTPQTTALERICPVEVRGHFMYGIHELSMAKVALAWVTVAGIMWHTFSLLRSFKSNRRSWIMQRERHEHAQELVVLKMEQGLVPRTQEYQPERKRDRIVRFLR